jgi:hypothetical protein
MGIPASGDNEDGCSAMVPPICVRPCLLLSFAVVPTAFSAFFFSVFLCFLSSWDGGIKKMTMPVLSGGSSFSACFFFVFLLCFILYYA